MQLSPPRSIRARLSAAACLLLATATPGLAQAADSVASTQLDASMLIYGEQSRAKVLEPTVRVTRLFANGQTISGQVGLDVITGATPSGKLPSGVIPPSGPGSGDQVQTITAASGGGGGAVATADPGAIPTTSFNDRRVALDADWARPFGLITPVVSGHFSRERDYQSVGGSGKISLEIFRRLTTLTLGGGVNRDHVFPTGGTHDALSDSIIIVSTRWNTKKVDGGLVGISQILTRRWMVAVNGSRSIERGYLTDPYKVVSVMGRVSGLTVGQITENRPLRRERNDILSSSVYHFTRDVLYLAHRYYWDSWGVRSNTYDLKYRHELQDSVYLQPHLRFYSQSPADFFRFGLVHGASVPLFVSSDERLGPLRSATVGATLGFTLPGTPGEWSLRAEFIRQFGKGHPDYVTGIQRQFDLFPPENIGSLVASYSLNL